MIHLPTEDFLTMHTNEFAVEHVHARILDIPTIRPHKLSFGTIQRQSPLIVEVRLRNGVTGYGEAATIGGPSWNEESPESIHHAVTAYLGPAVSGQDAARVEALLARMDLACRGNWFAKSAVEMAVIDALARSRNMPAWQLLGGKQRDSMPIAWTLASGSLDKDLEEAHRNLEARRHKTFKIKIGARDPQDDVAHVGTIARELAGQAKLTVDVNQAWDGNTAHRWLPALVDAGVHLIEQPVAKWNIDGLRSLSASHAKGLIMADETVNTPQDAMMLARLQACHVFSLKVAKHGGLLRTRKVAAIAEAADIGWYGGTMLETTLGSAASAQVFSTLPAGGYGCELLGPYLLVEDIVQERMEIRDFELCIPDGPGFGVEIDPEKLARFDRAGAGLQKTTVDFGKVKY
jgi:muconate cycloisomerase